MIFISTPFAAHFNFLSSFISSDNEPIESWRLWWDQGPHFGNIFDPILQDLMSRILFFHIWYSIAAVGYDPQRK